MKRAAWFLIGLATLGVFWLVFLGGLELPRPHAGLDKSRALQAWLWKKGLRPGDLASTELASARSSAQASLVTNQTLRKARIASGFDQLQPGAEDLALRQWQQQFEHITSAAQRLASAGLDETRFKAALREELLDLAWLEQEIAKRMRPITETDLEKWHRSHPQSFRVPEAHHVAHLFLKDQAGREQEIANIHQRLQAGELTWEAAVAGYSEDVRSRQTGGNLGWVSHERMLASFMEAVEQTAQGQISGPVRTKLGWHLVRVIEKRPGYTAPWQECQEEIRAAVENEQRQTALRELLAELEKTATAGG